MGTAVKPDGALQIGAEVARHVWPCEYEMEASGRLLTESGVFKGNTLLFQCKSPEMQPHWKPIRTQQAASMSVKGYRILVRLLLAIGAVAGN